MTEHEHREFSYKYLIYFSLPSIAASLLEPLSSVVDTAFIGKLDTQWLGALAVATTIFNSFSWMFNFLVHASTQAISQAYAKGSGEFIGKKLRVALLMALLVGVGSTLFLYLVRFYLYPLASSDDSLVPFIESYFVVRLWGHPFSLLYITLISLLRGLGKVRSSFVLVALTTGLNVFMSWLFLYPLNLGIEGAAYGTLVAHIVGSIIAFGFLLSLPVVKENIFRGGIEKESWVSFGKNSLDLFGRSFSLTTCFFLSTKLASTLGVTTLAAHQVMMQLWLFSSFFIDGFAITGNIFGARLFTEKRYDDLKIVTRRLLVIGIVVGGLFAVVYLAFGSFIWALFTDDKAVVQKINSIWLLVALSQMIMALAYVFDGLLFGMEAFAFLRRHMMIGVLLIFLPVSLGVLIGEELVYLWLGLVFLGAYRSIIAWRKTERLIQV